MTGSGQSEGSHEGRIRTYLPAQGLGKGCSPQTTTLQGRPGAGKATKQSPPNREDPAALPDPLNNAPFFLVSDPTCQGCP